MNLYVRLIWALLHAALAKHLSIFDAMHRPPRLPMIALPNDIDLNWHVNNGRLATLFDLGMMNLLARGGMLKILLKNRMVPTVGGAVFKYRHPVNIFARFVIETKLLCWDQKWFYCNHRLILKGGRTAVAAISRCCLVRRGRTVRPADFMAQLAFEGPSPDPSGVAGLFDQVNDAIDAGIPFRSRGLIVSDAA
jgi:acyl-CoA thioesterase FadM